MAASYTHHDPSTLTRAEVRKVLDDYVLVNPTENVGDLRVNDSITFSLEDWNGLVDPQVSQIVMLVNTMLYARGWRAREAYPITPGDTHKKEGL